MRKNIIIFFLLTLLFISGCGPLPTYKLKISMVYPIYSETLFYQDDFLSISFYIYEKAVYYEIKNNTLYTLEIDWDKSLFVLPSGESSSIYCFPKDKFNTYYMDKAYYFTKSTIPPYGKVSAYMIPRIMFKSEYDSYKYRYYYTVSGRFYSEFTEEDKNIALKIPVSVKGQIYYRTYEFVFRIRVIKVYE